MWRRSSMFQQSARFAFGTRPAAVVLEALLLVGICLMLLGTDRFIELLQNERAVAAALGLTVKSPRCTVPALFLLAADGSVAPGLDRIKTMTTLPLQAAVLLIALSGIPESIARQTAPRHKAGVVKIAQTLPSLRLLLRCTAAIAGAAGTGGSTALLAHTDCDNSQNWGLEPSPGYRRAAALHRDGLAVLVLCSILLGAMELPRCMCRCQPQLIRSASSRNMMLIVATTLFALAAAATVSVSSQMRLPAPVQLRDDSPDRSNNTGSIHASVPAIRSDVPARGTCQFEGIGRCAAPESPACWRNRPLNETSPTTGSRRPRVAVVMVLGTHRHMTRDANLVSMWNCYSTLHGLSLHVETFTFESSFYNKQHAVLKYLRHYDWVLYADTDTVVANASSSMADFCAGLSPDVHVVLSEMHFAGAAGFDAGVFLVRNSPLGHLFLQDWLRFRCRRWTNQDNGALNILFLHWVLGPDKVMEGNCTAMLFLPDDSRVDFAQYQSFFPCFYRLLGEPMEHYQTMGFAVNKRGSWQPPPLVNEKRYLPFQVGGWRGPGLLNSADKSSAPLIYHNKDIVPEQHMSRECRSQAPPKTTTEDAGRG